MKNTYNTGNEPINRLAFEIHQRLNHDFLKHQKIVHANCKLQKIVFQNCYDFFLALIVFEVPTFFFQNDTCAAN